jgi:hypothetical protein
MGLTDVLVDADWALAHLDDPGVVPAAAGEDDTKRTYRLLRCSCRHGRDAHRHYRPGSDCALCECPRWSPWNPVSRLARRRAR